MRITRESLLRLARQTVEERTRYNRRLVCVYLTGSLLEEDPLLGGTTDIDLIFVHDDEPAVPREIVPVTREIHIDIGHYSQNLFSHPRSLRTDPWVGSYLCKNPVALYDTQHWFEYTQASVCSQFNQPENCLLRARPLAEEARQIWMNLHVSRTLQGVNWLEVYLRALRKSANALSVLNGEPLAERRFMLQFPESAEMAGRPDLVEEFVKLYMAREPGGDQWQPWLEAWRTDFLASGQNENAPVRLNPARESYYLSAIDTIKDSHPAAAVWLLLGTWVAAVQCLPEAGDGQAWQNLLQQLGLDQPQFEYRLNALDAYLDEIEETLDSYEEKYAPTYRRDGY
jgi:hypothetical protein